MKQDWYPDELTQHWTLSAEERELLDSKTSATRLSFALLLKAFQFDGRFPDRREDIAGRIVTYVAQSDWRTASCILPRRVERAHATLPARSNSPALWFPSFSCRG